MCETVRNDACSHFGEPEYCLDDRWSYKDIPGTTLIEHHLQPSMLVLTSTHYHCWHCRHGIALIRDAKGVWNSVLVQLCKGWVSDTWLTKRVAAYWKL